MGRKSRLKKERRNAPKVAIERSSTGYVWMAVVGFAVGLLIGIVFGKTIPVWVGTAFVGTLFFLLFNRVLILFGLEPGSGSTPPPGAQGVDHDPAGGSFGSGGGISGAGGGGGGGAG